VRDGEVVAAAMNTMPAVAFTGPGPQDALAALTAPEVPLAARWFDDFTAEALPHVPRTPLEQLRRRLATGLDSGRLQLWHVDGEPVSMAMFRGPVHGTGRVGPVWTPPEHRRRGYAAAGTAACTQQLLDRGATTCMLYTDLANPTSNGVYTRLGYERVGDAVDLALRA
jgi:RimJ/RimL family protein N-acetyltransferase